MTFPGKAAANLGLKRKRIVSTQHGAGASRAMPA
jgi:hypothetical protein